MSTDEQDLVLGRLTRQSAETARTVAALEAKLSGFTKSLNDVGLQLNGTWNPKPKPVATIDDGVAAVSRLPERQEIINTLNELRVERKRAQEIAEQLAGMRP